MTTPSLDPLQLREATDCPVCRSSDAFQPKGAFGQYWMKRCTACGHCKNWRLPKITKTIIYLDQFVISNMVKAKQRIWTELHTKLSTLAGLQLVVCPYSDIHQDESLLSHALRDELKEMYRSFGGDNRFRETHDIEQSQLPASILKWLGVTQSEDARPAWCDAFDHNPHTWTTDLHVFADFPVHEPWVTDLRNRKQSLHTDIQSVCDYWKDNPTTFEQDVAEEIRGYARTSLKLYRSLAHVKFYPDSPPSVHQGVLMIHWLAVEVCKARPDVADPVAVVEEFFDSPHARSTPFLDIAACLWAKIAQSVRNPKPRTPDDGDSFDIEAISRHAPYCDAMFVEREFEELCRQVKLGERYSVCLFSMNTKDKFLVYLDDILKNMSDAHREGLALLYPHLISMLPSPVRQGGSS